jgi:ketosteroid isomerase-like protein
MSYTQATKPGALAAGLIALAACQQPAAPKVAAAPTDAEAIQIVDAAEGQWTSVDTAKILAAYKEGAVMFDVAAVQPSTDRATQNKWTDAFTAMKLSELSIADKHVQVLDADTIVASGIATLKSGAQGEPISFRYSDVYEKQPDGKWMIVHEHLSVPPAAAG